jgi:hypothetical protein
MTPIEPQHDFTKNDKLQTILGHPRLKDTKYNGHSQKYVRILCSNSSIYETNGEFLHSLLEKYGDVSFDEAIMLWNQRGIQK